MRQAKCGNCGYEGNVYGIPSGEGVSAPHCPHCGINSQLTAIASPPEELDRLLAILEVIAQHPYGNHGMCCEPEAEVLSAMAKVALGRPPGLDGLAKEWWDREDRNRLEVALAAPVPSGQPLAWCTCEPGQCTGEWPVSLCREQDQERRVFKRDQG